MNTRSTNFRTLDLNLLKVFDVLMVERNVTRAALRLAMTQPTVSNALRRLRDATNEELFIATSTGVTPTAHAETLWPIVRAALDSLQEAFQPQRFDPQAVRAFTLAMVDATAALFVPRLVVALQRGRTNVELRIVPLTTPDPRPMLNQGQADIALGFFPELADGLTAETQNGVIQREQLYACNDVCVMRRANPLAENDALTLDAYCAAEHVRVSFAGRAHGITDEALAHLGRTRRVMITVNSSYCAAAVVHQSDLLTVLPRSFVPATGFASHLAVRAMPFALPGIDLGLLWHRRYEANTAHRWLREILMRAAADITKGPELSALG